MSSPPTTLGKYQIIREIARSNDIVYEGYDPLMNRRVALKELSMPRGAPTPQLEDRVNRFKREAQAVGTLAHPNIMTVYEYGQEADRHFMAMEYLDGHTLRNEIDTKGFLSPQRAVEIATEILKGLGHAHAKGVIHRDIKPDNIQLLSSGEIKITDFGIARLTFQPNLTMDGQVFGTPSYMSPEQVVGKELDQRSDLFSVGVLLYEMITGQKPYPGDSVVSITYAIMNKEPDPPPQAGFALGRVIMKALDKTPSMRYKDSQEMIAALADAIRPEAQQQQAIPLSQTQGQAPYNPWATAAPPTYAYPPVNNPYAQPQTQALPAPPPAYPYNPYAQPGAMGSPHLPNMPQGLPTWYPPPPRAPLLKAETRLVMAKAFLWFLIFASVVGAVLIALAMVGNRSTDPTIDPQINRPPQVAVADAEPTIRAVGAQPVGSPGVSAPPNRSAEGQPLPASVDEIRSAFHRLQRDHTPPDDADRALAQQLYGQLGDRDADLSAEIKTYFSG